MEASRRENDSKQGIAPDKDDATVISREKSLGEGEIETQDPFQPLPGVALYDGGIILTVRAVVTGAILGSLIGCSNMYLGLKTGFGADATLFSSIFGFGILKLLERSQLPLVSGHFGPHENNIIQATALGCMGIIFIFISGVPALYQMSLLSGSPKSDYGKLVCLSIISGFWGLGFTVPLRSMFILKLARQLSLHFPLGTASALTIRALHSATEGTQDAKRNLAALSSIFSGSLVWSWIYKWGGHGILGAVSWGWFAWSWSPSIIGMGMLIGLNPALSFLLGSVLAWGIIGPILVHTGAASGIPYDPKYPGLVTYNVFDPTKFVDDPSPRYWILWPAVFLMLSVSLTTILLESNNFARLLHYSMLSLKHRLMQALGKGDSQPHSEQDPGGLGAIDDPIPPEYRVRWWEWSSVSLVTFIIAFASMKSVFGISPEMSLLHLVLGLFWAFIVIQVFGAAGIAPTSAVAKGSQFITGAILREQVDKIGIENAARSNLVGATVSAGAAQQAAELVQDFRTGFLLGTPARAQWYAQLIGTSVAVLVAPALFILFTSAFPCILDPTATTCQFALPSVTAWRIVTLAILSPTFPISRSSWIASIVTSLLGVGTVCLQRWCYQRPRYKHWANYIPNMSIVGMAMTVPGATTAVTVVIGALAATLWKKYKLESHARYVYPVAAGGIAGEGVAYIVLSILQIAQVAGPMHCDTKLGCVVETC